ncbi:MAG: cell division transport system permease protein [Actinoplanes sp.]|nr:cell division transport system permease protein [Actinoplanes sp.]
MDTNLREYFDRAVSGDPGADLGEMAHAAIAQGGRVRRRRKQMAVAGVAAGVVMVLGAVAGVNHRSPVTGPANPAVVAPEMMLVAALDCSAKPVQNDATDVVIFPGDADGHVTDQMVSQLRSDLTADPRVATLFFETHEQIYQRFQKQWPNNPDFVASVSPNDLPEFFRLRLVDATKYTAFRTQYAARDDVMLIEGRICRESAPVGGLR